MDLSIELAAAPHGPPFEIAEHKGAGHPDTLCDALAEAASRALCRHYVAKVGTVLHHNVDKALLIGGAAHPAFGGGEVTSPIEITIAGRASPTGDDDLGAVIRGACTAYLHETFHALDPARHVELHCRVREGSRDLRSLFGRAPKTPLANDTSFGAGYAPLSPLEHAVLAVGERLRDVAADKATPYVGEDVKVLGVLQGQSAELTIACAFVGHHLPSLSDYRAARDKVARLVAETARVHLGACEDVTVLVNAADDLDRGDVYLTVTGTSAEGGDDGQVGRGNRVNGLITPARPMSLEAAAGKNPASHTGKLYNVLAHDAAAAIVARIPEIARAEVFLVSRIGAPIDRPRFAHVRVLPRPGRTLSPSLRTLVTAVLEARLEHMAALTQRIIHGQERLF